MIDMQEAESVTLTLMDGPHVVRSIEAFRRNNTGRDWSGCVQTFFEGIGSFRFTHEVRIDALAHDARVDIGEVADRVHGPLGDSEFYPFLEQYVSTGSFSVRRAVSIQGPRG